VVTANARAVTLWYRALAVNALSLAAVLALALAGCGGAPSVGAVCVGTGGCATGTTCLAGKCRAPDATPGAVDSIRILLAPLDLAVLASRGDGAVPEAIAIGREDAGSLVVLFRFVATWRDDAEVVSAFLTLDPLDGAPPARTSTSIEIARVLDPWTSETATWGRQPRLGLPEIAAVVPGRPSRRLRVDVTSLVKRWPKRADDDHGIALLAEGHDPYGALFSTGLSSGSGPRLEVYVR
jgi:hypothetical protein